MHLIKTHKLNLVNSSRVNEMHDSMEKNHTIRKHFLIQEFNLKYASNFREILVEMTKILLCKIKLKKKFRH